MEAASTSFDLVHVLRHSSRPSEQLGSALEIFYPPESQRNRSFVDIKTLGKITLDAYKHAQFDYSLDLIEARKAVEQHRGQSLEISPAVDIRRIGSKTIDVLLGLQDNRALYALNKQTLDFLPEGIEAYDAVDLKYSLFARIHSSIAITDSFQENAVEQYKRTYQHYGPKHLLNILPQTITGMDQFIATPRYR
jgi:hypothetical protein